MTPEQAATALTAEDAIDIGQSSLDNAKRLVDELLHLDIPAQVSAPPDQCKTGCQVRAHIIALERDVPRIAAHLQADWQAMVQREGNDDDTIAGLPPQLLQPNDDGDLPCPACGTAAPLVDGCCSDCGLCLE